MPLCHSEWRIEGEGRPGGGFSALHRVESIDMVQLTLTVLPRYRTKDLEDG